MKQKLYEALQNLVDQIERSNAVDDHGHELKNLKALADAKALCQSKELESYLQDDGGITRLLNVARGCHDYNGGYVDPEATAFHHGIQTVVQALDAAAKNDPNDGQVNVLERIGAASNHAAA